MKFPTDSALTSSSLPDISVKLEKYWNIFQSLPKFYGREIRLIKHLIWI